MAEWLHTLQNIQAQLPDDPTAFWFHYALRHGSMKFGLYAPRGQDTQGPHNRMSFTSSSREAAYFVKNNARRPVNQHDVLFVEAGAAHRFVDFSDDFFDLGHLLGDPTAVNRTRSPTHKTVSKSVLKRV